MHVEIRNSLQAKTSASTDSGREAQKPKVKVAAEVGKVLPLNPAPAEAKESSPASTNAKVSEMVENINQSLQSLRRELHFSVDEGSGRTIIKVVNTDTEEVIRQIPSEEVLSLMDKLDDGSGLLLDTQA